MAYNMPSTALAAIRAATAEGDTVGGPAVTAQQLAACEAAKQAAIAARDSAIAARDDAVAVRNQAVSAKNQAISQRDEAEAALAALQAAAAAYLAKIDAEEDATDERAALDDLLPDAGGGDDGGESDGEGE